MAEPASPTRKRSALLALLLVAPAPSLGAAMAFHWAPGALGNAAYAACKALLYGAPLLWLVLVARHRPKISRPGRRGLVFGLVSGGLIGAAVLLAYALLPEGAYDPALLREAAAKSGFDTPGRFLAVATYLCVVNALLEEYAFRWFLYGRCRELLPRVPAIAAGALIFTAHHVIVLRTFFDWPVALLASAGVLVGGVIWTWTYERFQSIWPGYVSHALVDVAIMLIGWRLLFP